VIALICGFVVFVEQSWFGPARSGRAAQVELDAVFAKNRWDGYAGTWHYDYRVRIVSSDIGDEEMVELYPILHELPWLKFIQLDTPSMTDTGLANMKREFPNCRVIDLASARAAR